MSKAQKVIKYISLAFAFFLIVNILLGITYGIKAVFYIFNDNEDKTVKLETLNLNDVINKNITGLEIEIDKFNLSIKRGKVLKIETNNDKLEIKESLGKLIVEEKNKNWFSNTDDKLVIYIPDSLILDNLLLESGAGTVNIDDLSVNNLSLNLDAGKVMLNKLNVFKKCEIDGGAGEINLKNSSINNLDLDIGLGKVILNAQILGNSEINAGIGSLDLDLFGSLNDYKISVDKGIGNFTISSVDVKDDAVYGIGINKIKIDGGIGEITVDFEN